MTPYLRLNPEERDTIVKSLRFVEKKIGDHFSEKRKNMDESLYPVINTEHAKETNQLAKATNLLMEDTVGNLKLDVKSYQSVIDVFRSALVAYLQETLKAKNETGLNEFDQKIQQIQRVIDSDDLQRGKTDVYSKYYYFSEVFFSYAHEDRVLAGKIASLLKEKDIDVFLAHEKIEISKKWRDEILKHLKNDNFLLALLTENYEKSVYTHQEAGYMMGKKGKNIPLIVGKTDIKNFGFLETFQGVSVTEENLKDAVEKMVNTIRKSN